MPSLTEAALRSHGVLRGAATVVLAASLVIGCVGRHPVRTVTIGDEHWTVYENGGEGMRGLPGFGEADGMLFDMGSEVDPAAVAFGMENVGYPIDIAWFDGTGALVSRASMTPCAVPPCPLYHADRHYRWAIEAPPGALDDLRPSDRLVVADD